ncbi:MAG TPA: DUF4440 domain-containing protein [Pyrinomonadaceae bacterium]
MKRCSTCNRTYTDPNLSFCIDDGTPLTVVDDDATVVTPRGNDNDWNATAYQPPRPYVPPGAPVKRRRAWPWVVGILGAFILGILMIGLAVAILGPRMLRRLEQQSVNTTEPENANRNTNTNATERVNTPPPADHDQVLAQLTEIENDWTVANINADKKKLDRILADDFVTEVEGQLISKADYIRTISRDATIDKWEFKDLKLTLIGDRATLSGTITYFYPSEDRAYEFVDRFVWRDGRWQATGADIKQKESPGVTL